MSNATVFLLTLSPTIEESEDDIEIFPIVDYELCSAHWAVIKMSIKRRMKDVKNKNRAVQTHILQDAAEEF